MNVVNADVVTYLDQRPETIHIAELVRPPSTGDK